MIKKNEKKQTNTIAWEFALLSFTLSVLGRGLQTEGRKTVVGAIAMSGPWYQKKNTNKNKNKTKQTKTKTNKQKKKQKQKQNKTKEKVMASNIQT